MGFKLLVIQFLNMQINGTIPKIKRLDVSFKTSRRF